MLCLLLPILTCIGNPMSAFIENVSTSVVSLSVFHLKHPRIGNVTPSIHTRVKQATSKKKKEIPYFMELNPIYTHPQTLKHTITPKIQETSHGPIQHRHPHNPNPLAPRPLPQTKRKPPPPLTLNKITKTSISNLNNARPTSPKKNIVPPRSALQNSPSLSTRLSGSSNVRATSATRKCCFWICTTARSRLFTIV